MSTSHCPACGEPLSAQAPLGLCPACLLRAGIPTPGNINGVRFQPPSPETLAPLFPQFEITGLIGQGGMGAVYRARQPNLDRDVALKILPPETNRDPGFAERFAREARALARLNHPNIVAVHDVGRAGEYHYLVMEFVDGVTLRHLLRSGRITAAEALGIVPQICDALQFAHDLGVVHRDIKPENILLDKKGAVKIADFGLAKIVGVDAPPSGITDPRDVMGTPHYMAPEQIERPLAVDHRADIYSLGVVFYQMLTGELPLGRFAPPSRRVQVDVRLDEIVLRALEKDPEARYQQVSGLKTRVETVATSRADAPLPVAAGGFEYRSAHTIFGLPFVHVAFGLDPHTGQSRVAKGILAIGSRARGLVAIGGIASGAIAIGGAAYGGLAVGGLAIGVSAVGGTAVALSFALGGLAVAPVAIGGMAAGYLTYGNGVFGAHALGQNAMDPSARAFFSTWATPVLYWGTAVALFGLAIGQLIGLAATWGDHWRQRTRRSRWANLSAMSGCAALTALLVAVNVAVLSLWWHRNLRLPEVFGFVSTEAVAVASNVPRSGARPGIEEGGTPLQLERGQKRLNDRAGARPIGRETATDMATPPESVVAAAAANVAEAAAAPATSAAAPRGIRNQPTLPHFDEMESNPAILQIQLKQAQRAREEMSKRASVGRATSTDIQLAADEVELIEAKLAGNRTRFAAVATHSAARRLEEATSRGRTGTATTVDVQAAAAELEIAKIRAAEADRAARVPDIVPPSTAARGPRSAQRPAVTFDTMESSPEVLRIEWRRAHLWRRAMQDRQRAGVATDDDVADANTALQLIEAKIDNHPVRFAAIQLEAAKGREERTAARYSVGLISGADLEAAKAEREIAQVRFDTALQQSDRVKAPR